MTVSEACDRVRFAYPQVYYACHTRHVRRRSGPASVSTRDSEILVHLDPSRPTTLTALARHMDLAKSTLSEALKKLEALGHVRKTGRTNGNRRELRIVLTPRGVSAVRASSVLDAERLQAALSRLTARQRATAIKGLATLAEACRGLAVRVDR
ncbi:MAG TPA: winged helix DNA-binding protein [Gemmatimonadaceae bacterium]|nr:winged helix DNA-binding protein [Gemmatimonadaceae bacterium]